MRKPTELTQGFNNPMTPTGVEAWIDIGAEIQQLYDIKELLDFILNPYNGILSLLTGDLPQEDNFEELKNKILVNVVAERISYFYHNEKTGMDKRDNRVKRFFAAISDQPQDFFMLLSNIGLSEDTVKNFKRHDHLKHLGKVTRKKNKELGIVEIWRRQLTVEEYRTELLDDLHK